MCTVCGQMFCPKGCPEYEMGGGIYICSYCGADIMAGEEYYSLSGEYYCSDCIYSSRRTAGE
ncbi:MAG: hypothetical protein J6K88_02500 [Oscillospiraceae bacterium]|nr:hypothetical protein [Oscillospiraceae bacterium]